MKCPECIKEEKQSKVYPGLTTSTAMYCPGFYDEEGRFHNHDYNISYTDYRCSNYHSWQESIKGKCWCGWSADNQ